MKKDNYVIIFLKGFLIGLGIIFPISASVLALVMGVYKRILNIVNNFKSEFKKEWKFILALGLGICLSALVSCLLIGFTYEKYPVATLLFFVGLIAGGLPVVTNKIKNKFNLKNAFWLVVGFLALLSLSIFGVSNEATISSSTRDLIIIFFVGMTAAGTMIIPGVSGSAILVTLGYYKPMLDVIKNLVKFNSLNTNIIIAGIFILGMILGIIIVSKLMDYFLNKHETKSFFAITGFVVASIVNLIVMILGYKIKLLELIIGLVLGSIGFILSCKYLKED